ncbi:MAG: MFS transporter [Gammaproteobacteria bacterium]|nr:MFS transporter [Gammaproteobacteria bacterium]NNF60271.1 MFS transporter [Gammaproteobacteria bacterium]NNM20379.1 MFS transporter [Gammaproteobacteria bacterium]
MSRLLLRRPVLSWALYDWANSAFATTVLAGLFPIFFKQYWNAGVDVTVSTFRLGLANSGAALVVAVLAPLLGAIADRSGARKRGLIVFALTGVVATTLLFFIGAGGWLEAAVVFAAASVGFALANVFNDSMLVDVSDPADMDVVSGYGYALGYLGGGLLFGLNVVMVLQPGWFGLDAKDTAVRWSFVTVAIWWVVFSIPLVLFVDEKPTADRVPLRAAVGAGLRQLRDTVRHLGNYKPAMFFLLAYWLYIDGVYTVIKLAADYGLSLGFADTDLIKALLLTQFVGFPSALAFGWLGRRIGADRGILIGLAVYLATSVWAYFLASTWQFYAMAVLIGLVQGGVQSLSRAYFGRLIPADMSGEFFGLFNMVGRFAAVIGPVLAGTVVLLTGNARLEILAIVPLFVAGAGLLLLVRTEAGRA